MASWTTFHHKNAICKSENAGSCVGHYICYNVKIARCSLFLFTRRKSRNTSVFALRERHSFVTKNNSQLFYISTGNST